MRRIVYAGVLVALLVSRRAGTRGEPEQDSGIAINIMGLNYYATEWTLGTGSSGRPGG